MRSSENKPDPALYAKTVAAALGEVDAFASHSWSDEGGAKFDALHEWAKELRRGGRRSEPDADVLIWLDKACINQSSDIDTALAGLPVFLAGCKQLLVLAGPTYTSRLWWYVSHPAQRVTLPRIASELMPDGPSCSIRNRPA